MQIMHFQRILSCREICLWGQTLIFESIKLYNLIKQILSLCVIPFYNVLTGAIGNKTTPGETEYKERPHSVKRTISELFLES